jgi:glycosyltransferase involved in cell wall biosynthesis
MISVVIPAYNEAERIGPVVHAALGSVREVIVIDDGSQDKTAQVAKEQGARVVRQANSGYLEAIKRGFIEARGAIIVTMDADGEHAARDIEHLIEPIQNDRADYVLGGVSILPGPLKGSSAGWSR